jgi:hypothetical protein
MGDSGPIVLRLEVVKSDQEPVSGVVRAADGRAREFSGWSELFAALAALLAGSPLARPQVRGGR